MRHIWLDWEIGTPISINFADGEHANGWFYGNIDQGILISLDRNGRDVRFYSKRWVSVGRRDAPLATFVPENVVTLSKQLQELNDSIQREMQRAIEQLDFRLLQRLISRASELRKELYRNRYVLEIELHRLGHDYEDPTINLVMLSLARSSEVLELHEQLFEELANSGITKICEENHDKIRTIPPKYIIPGSDGAFLEDEAPPEDDLRSRELPWNEQAHRATMAAARRRRDDVILGVLSDKRAAEVRKSESGEDIPSRAARYVGASLRILSGAGLTVGNAAIAINSRAGLHGYYPRSYCSTDLCRRSRIRLHRAGAGS